MATTKCEGPWCTEDATIKQTSPEGAVVFFCDGHGISTCSFHNWTSERLDEMSEPERTDDGWQVLDGWQNGEDSTERPVVVGDVWEGVLEVRTVEVVAILRAGWFDWVKFAVPGQTVCSFAPIDEFRERFTRRGR